jgi:hypothetical protein
MYFKYQQTANLISVKDDYATLVKVMPNGDLLFGLTYAVNPGQAFNHGARIVNVQALSRYVSSTPLLGVTQRGIVDTAALVNNIRLMMLGAKQAVQQRLLYVLAQTNSNILSYVSNEILQQLLAGVSPKDIQQLNLPQLQVVQSSDVKQTNDPQPILHRVANSLLVPDISTAVSGSSLANPQALMQDMIVRQGLDPAYILQLTSRSQPESVIRHGLSNTSRAVELVTDPATQLLNFHLFPPTSDVPPKTTNETVDQELVQVLRVVTQETVEIVVPLIIPAVLLRMEHADLTHAFVQFDLINGDSNEPVDTVIKTLNIARELQVYNTPKVPPTVKAAMIPTSAQGNLQIKQLDPGATGVQVYKKVIFAAAQDIDNYSLIGTYPLSVKQEALQVKVDVSLSSAVVYRVIPVGAQDTQSFEFTNVIIKPPHYTPLRSVALTGLQVDQGIQLEARSIPQRCVAIQFLKWNLTTHDSAFTVVNGDVGFVDDASRQADFITTTDNSVTNNNVYRYVARLIYVDGDTEDFGDVTIEFVTPAPGQVTTTIADMVVTHDTTPDVSFTINTITIDTDMDAIKKMLENQDLTQYFTGDIAAQRDQLASLISHTVQRVDLTTGVRENFGTVTVPNFSDSALRKTQAVTELQYGHVYRYEIYPLLRASETLFKDFVKTSVDPVTKKPYTWSPAKFLHPITLTRGVIVTQAGAAQRYAKDPMSFGVVGSVATVEASFDNDSAKIVNQEATAFNRNLNIVTWQVNGDITQVDHFLVLKTVGGIRSVLGKAHSEFPHGVCQYFHPVTHRDNGALNYVVIPVMNDYKVGSAVTTNTVIVDVP